MSRPRSRLGCLLALGDDFAAALDPDGAAGGALQKVLGVAVRMHVDLDSFDAVTFWALHGVSPVNKFVVASIYRTPRKGASLFFC